MPPVPEPRPAHSLACTPPQGGALVLEGLPLGVGSGISTTALPGSPSPSSRLRQGHHSGPGPMPSTAMGFFGEGAAQPAPSPPPPPPSVSPEHPPESSCPGPSPPALHLRRALRDHARSDPRGRDEEKGRAAEPGGTRRRGGSSCGASRGPSRPCVGDQDPPADAARGRRGAAGAPARLGRWRGRGSGGGRGVLTSP